MEGESVIYLGRAVSKQGFRVFIYSLDETKLVESWDEYLDHISSGLWFATHQDALNAALAVKVRQDAADSEISRLIGKVEKEEAPEPKAKRGKK